MAGLRHFQATAQIPRPRLRLLLAIALCAPVLALARSGLDQRISELRDQSRLSPDQALPRLLELQSRIPAASPRTRAELLVQICKTRLRLDQEGAAAATADQLIAYGKSLRDDVVISKGLLVKAIVLQDDSKTAHALVVEAERLALRGDDRSLLVEAGLEAADVSFDQGDFPTALAKLQSAVDSARQVGDDPMLLFNALRAQIRFLVQIKERAKAFSALDELTAITQQQRLPIQMVLLKASEFIVASAFDQPERAERAQLQSLALQRQYGALHMLVATLNNLADSYVRGRDYARAARYAAEALQVAKERNQSGGDATARVNLGHAYLGMGRIAEGKSNFLAGLAWFEQSGSKPDVQETLLEYGQALEAAGDTKGALAAYHRERAISNELFETKRQQAVLELQERYESDRKQRQIELLGSENRNRRLQQRVWWLLAAVATLAAAVVGLMYRKVRRTNALLEVTNLELKQRSTRDPLTGLYNRRHFQDFMTGLGTDRTRGDRTGGDIVGALFLLDADHFKDVNDTYGHAAGDTVLKTIAEKLRAALRETDMIVRWGGEEFLVFVPSVARDGVDEVARRILACVSAHTVRHQEHDIAVRVSVGFAPFPLAPSGVPLPWERVVNLADMALYLAKTNGRNRACGVRGFGSFERTSMEAIEQDLEGAWRAGSVDLSMVHG